MKTIRTIATILLAAFMVLGPVAAYAQGATMTIATNNPTYSGSQAITISGTVSPTPSVPSNVVITTIGPMGAVDISSVPVSTATGSFSYTLTAGGNAGWVSGTYTVNGTWGAQGLSATKTTTFIYTATSGPSSSVTVVTVTVTSTSTTTQAEVTETVTSTTTTPSSDAAALASMQTTLTAIQSSLSGLTSAVNTISSGITAVQSSITSSTSGFGALAGVPSSISTLTTNVNNDTTYVLVVAALAAITLVLELAILVRKLS